MLEMFSDFRFAIRMLKRHPNVALTAIATLALGLGLTTTMYSIVQGALSTLPFEGAERLYHLEIYRQADGGRREGVPLHDFLEWREQQSSFEDLSAYAWASANLAGPEAPPERVSAAYVTQNAFEPLEVKPFKGRAFNAEDVRPGAPPVVLVGWSLWQRRFAGDPELLGQSIRVNGEWATIVGIMPAGFEFPFRENVWLPLRITSTLERGAGPRLGVYGRLVPDRSLAAAEAEFSGIGQRLEEAWPEFNEGVVPVIKPYIREFIGDDTPAIFKAMLGAVFGVLLIACVNVANLLLARAGERSREIAIRSAFGAERRRLMVQVLIEVTLWAVLGAALGIGLAFLGISLFRDQMQGIDLPYWIEFQVDYRVFAFALGCAFLATIVAGLFPAWSLSGGRLNQVLRDQERSTSGRLSAFSRSLLAVEICLSLALLVVTALMIRGALKLQEVEFNFQIEGILTAQIELPARDYPEESSRQAFYERLQERLAALPGVESVALAARLPAIGSGSKPLTLEGEQLKDGYTARVRAVVIGPGFFHTFGSGVLEGRDISWRDDGEHPAVVLVNQSFVERYFDEGNALGQRLRLGGDDSVEPWRTIVGVVPDFHISGVEDRRPSGIYLPLAQEDRAEMQIVVRTTASSSADAPLAWAPLVRGAVAELDSDLSIFDVDSMSEVLREESWHYGLFGSLFLIFGGVALFLALIGLYSLMAFAVSGRRREIGIRRAFGAEGAAVMKLVFRQAAIELLVGTAAGIGLALFLGHALSSLMYQVEPYDPLVLAGVVVTMSLACALAVYIPARQAARIDPSEALRH